VDVAFPLPCVVDGDQPDNAVALALTGSPASRHSNVSGAARTGEVASWIDRPAGMVVIGAASGGW